MKPERSAADWDSLMGACEEYARQLAISDKARIAAIETAGTDEEIASELEMAKDEAAGALRCNVLIRKDHANALARSTALLVTSRQEAVDLTKRLSDANDDLASAREAARLLAAVSDKSVSNRAGADADGAATVEMDGVSVTYDPNAHIGEMECYRLAGDVRTMLVSAGFFVRGDFIIRSYRPR